MCVRVCVFVCVCEYAGIVQICTLVLRRHAICMYAGIYTRMCVCYYMIDTHTRICTQECAPSISSHLFAVVLVVKLVETYSVRCRRRKHIIRRTHTCLNTCVNISYTFARTHTQRAHQQALYYIANTYHLEDNAVFSEGLTQTPRVILQRVRLREACTFVLKCGFLQRMY
jgi:hypothetical protein